MKRLVLCLWVASLAFACSEKATDTGADASSDTITLTDTPTTTDGANLGDGEDGTTTPPVPACKEASDCDEAGSICTCQGKCLPEPTTNPCLTDKNCPSDQWCNACTGFCELEVGLCEPCEADGACGEGGACLPFVSGGSFCGTGCIADAGCPAGFACIEVSASTEKMCVPKTGQCQDLGLCENDGECPDGQKCHDLKKECVPGCTEDDGCAVGLVCVAARCVEPCTSDADCEAGALCDDKGHCKVPGSCETKADCPAPETYCNKSTGMCAPGCLIDSDCGDAAKMCKDKACVPKGCEHNYQCAFEEICDKSNGACIPTPDDHCATCDAQDQNACGGKPNLCLTLTEEDKNTGEAVEKGDFCFLPCVNDPVDACPQGYNCQAIELDGISGNYCVRSCWVDPVGGP